MIPSNDQSSYLRPNQPEVCAFVSVPQTPCSESPCEDRDCDPNCSLCELRDPNRVIVKQDGFAADKPCSAKNVASHASSAECRTVPNLRKRRGRFTVACTALTVGLLVLSFSIPDRNDLLAPGPLTSKHAQLLDPAGADRCAHCHAAGNRSFMTWLSDTLSGGKTLSQPQSELCLKCHQEMKGSGAALLAHNLPVDEIRRLTAKYQGQKGKPGWRLGNASGHQAGDQIACSSCHKEHHGADHDLLAMTDRQCQSCHQQTFHRFDSGHPEFASQGPTRRSRIAFDHASHFGKHFPTSKKSFQCNQCHLDDASQNVKLLAPFEKSCAECHTRDIENSLMTGLELISLPMVDRQALDRFAVNIGIWPSDCEGDFDGALTPLTRHLLTLEVESRDALKRFQAKYGENFEFTDIDPEDEQQVRDAGRLIWSIKRSLHELGKLDRSELAQKLTASDQPDRLAVAQRWLDLVDPITIRRASFQWLPGLEQEFTGMKQKGGSARLPALSRSHPARNVGWKRVQEQDDEELLAENPLRKRMGQGSANQPKSAENPEPRVTAKLSESKSENSVPKQPKINRLQDPVAPGIISNQFARKEEKGGRANPTQDRPENLLAINPLAKLLDAGSQENPDQLVPSGPDDPLAQPESKVVNEKTEQPDAKSIAGKDKFPSAEELLRLMQKSAASRSGIWLEDPVTFTIRYRPTGHADPFISAFTDWAAERTTAGANPQLSGLLQPQSTGSCVNCHTIDEDSRRGISLVNWKAEYRNPDLKKLTKFSHRPHLIQPSLSDCSHCHQLESERLTSGLYRSRDAFQATSNFTPIQKSNCTSCHQKGMASQGCTTCHRYHALDEIK